MGDSQRTEILTVSDLSKTLGSFFNTCIGRSVGWGLLKIFKIQKINDLHRKYIHYSGCDFTTRLLSDPSIAVSYTIKGQEYLQQMKQGNFITVSNHPFGALDGIILLDLIGRIRPDYKIVVNHVLSNISALKDHFVPVVPYTRHQIDHHDPYKNIGSVRDILNLLHQGNPLGIFPAGGIERYSLKDLKPHEQSWKDHVGRLIKRVELPIFPIRFSGHNTLRYHILSSLSETLKAMLIPSEVFSKKGEVVSLTIDHPIRPSDYKDMDAHSLIHYLRDKTLSL